MNDPRYPSTWTMKEIMAYEQREEDRREAYSDGLDAWNNHRHVSDNPHGAGSRKHKAWEAGWIDAELEFNQ